MNLFERERSDFAEIDILAGVDEAGRGPLAGPVVVAAVILGKDFPDLPLDDSKKLSEKKREEFFEVIIQKADSYKIIEISPLEVDKLNIFQATMKGMEIAVLGLNKLPQLSLIDGNKVPPRIGLMSKPIIKGDGKYASIAAASILAKVTRDRIMIDLDKKFPQYNLKKNKGYPTKEHINLLRKFGVSAIHRKSYKPVRELL